MHEFIVYHKIPAEAVIHSFTVNQVVSLTERDHGLNYALRLATLRTMGDFKTKILRTLKEDNVEYTADVIMAIARFAKKILDLTAMSRIEHIEHVISDITQVSQSRAQCYSLDISADVWDVRAGLSRCGSAMRKNGSGRRLSSRTSCAEDLRKLRASERFRR